MSAKIKDKKKIKIKFYLCLNLVNFNKFSINKNKETIIK